MYNSITEEKIKAIPSIGDIDSNRLPQELTKIYAQIVSLRSQIVAGTIDFQNENLISGLKRLRKLANNLETILLTNPNHEQKESIAFVAATANSLIHKMGLTNEEFEKLLELDSISTYIASVILFLIGNSQADAAEVAISIDQSRIQNLTQQRLISYIVSLATGGLSKISEGRFNEEEVIQKEDFEQTALNYLWRELGLGIEEIAKKLLGKSTNSDNKRFDKVIDLSISEPGLFNQRSAFSGPYRLAKLLKMLEKDILDRAVINIPVPQNVDPTPWELFLEKLAKTRPYLWENHKEAVNNNLLNPGVSAVLTLPTGAGKSTLSELKIAACLYSGKKVIYLVPTHALEDQVNKNLRPLFSEFEPANIEFGGEYTEFDEIENFPILVMTPERCLTFSNMNPDFFASVGLVIFDEFHLIHGVDIKKDRRSIDAMYCLLSLFSMAPKADYLLISAMVENGEQIAAWIAQVTSRECKLFNSTWKPTRQLHGCLVFEESDIKRLYRRVRAEKTLGRTKNPPVSLKRTTSAIPHCFFSLKNIWETSDDEDYFRSQILDHQVNLGIGNYWQLTSNRNEIAAKLAIHFSMLGLKTLVFVDDPRIAKSTAQTISDSLAGRENNYEYFINRNKQLIESLTLELGDIDSSYFNNCQNVGTHHGLLLPIERTLIENYFKYPKGLTALVATATLAQGINLPAEIVIIAGDDRFNEDGGGRQRVNPHELLNAAGRAGRAGLSSQGAVILIPGDIVTIKDSVISDRWWELKDEVFSKGDQCLNIEDPLEYFLDSLQENLQQLDTEQTKVLYRFKPENLSEHETKNMLEKSFYAFKASKSNQTEKFDVQVRNLLDRRNELDSISDEDVWLKEIGIKTGLEPAIIYELDNALEQEGIENLLSKSIIELVDWFFTWLSSDETFIERIFTKPNTIEQIKRMVGLKPDATFLDIQDNINILNDILKYYIQGMPFNELNTKIPDVGNQDKSPYLLKSRIFVNRLVPELSFGFGILSMILVEKSLHEGIERDGVPWDIKVLASCIREGFDTSYKLFYKNGNKLLLRVETHLEYQKENDDEDDWLF